MYMPTMSPDLEPKDVKKQVTLCVVMLVVGSCLILATGCTNVKKSTDKKEQVIEQGRTTKIEYRTNTVYTDTGSTTTYYRDSLIFKNDTVIQPIEKIVNRWFKQEIKHDTLYKLQHDTITVKVKEVVTLKEKTATPFWMWLVLIFAIIAALATLRPSFLNWIANRKF